VGWRISRTRSTGFDDENRDLSLRELPPLLDPKVWIMTHNLPNSARPDPLAISSRLPQSRLL